MNDIALSMPYVFMAFFGLMVCVAPQWRFTAFIVFMSAVLNISLGGLYLAVADMMSPLVPTFTIYALIDLLTAKILITVKPFTLFGRYCGVRGAAPQAFVLMLFIAFNGIAFLDYTFTGYVLLSVYIPVIFVLNLSQIMTMGVGIYGYHRKTQPNRNFAARSIRQYSSRMGRIVVPKEGHREV